MTPIKKENSKAFENLDLKKDNALVNNLLRKEQGYLCAYTEMNVMDQSNTSHEIDHFKPKRKFPKEDKYENWFVIDHKCNQRKGDRWIDDDTLLPTNPELTERVLYVPGTYTFMAGPEDKPAANLMKLVKLNHPHMLLRRESYINRMSKKQDLKEWFRGNPEFYQYPTALLAEGLIDTEFIEEMKGLLVAKENA